MKTIATIASTLVLVASLTSLARADQDQYADGPVSQINGVPIKVGEHNEYYQGIDKHRWNVASDPVEWIIGRYGVSVSYAVNDHFAIRASGDIYSPRDVTGHELDLTLSAPIYFRRTYQGVFLEPGLLMRSSTYDNYDGTSRSTMVAGPEVLVGWQWMWDSGLNVAVAAGVGRDMTTSTDADGNKDSGQTFGNAYLRFGYAF